MIRICPRFSYNFSARPIGRPLSDTSVYTGLCMVIDCFEEAGILLKRGLLDVDLALELLPTVFVLKKLEPFLIGFKKEFGPEYEMYFEFLCTEFQKGERL